MEKYYFIIILFFTSCSASRRVINNIYTYDKPTNIYGEPSCTIRDTFTDNLKSEFMSMELRSYYESLSTKDYAIIDVVNHKAGTSYYSDIYTVSEHAKEGYLKINKYLMEYIANHGNDIKSIRYQYNGKTISTNKQFKNLVQLSSKNIHSVILQQRDTTIVVFIE